MKSVLLSGCGNIGFRHLQAILAMPDPAEVTVVEPNIAAHERIAALFPAAEAKGFRFTLCKELLPIRQTFDLVVIATSADTRRAAFDSIVSAHDVRVMILEKVLFQTIQDLDEVGQILAERGIAAYVNCPRRYFPGYRALFADLAAIRPVDITIEGAGFGLASNGIHLIDLAEYLNDAALVAFSATDLLAGSVPAKRAGCVEVFGQVTGKLSNGAKLTINCANADPMSIRISLNGHGYSAEIDEIAREIRKGSGPATGFDSKFVSEIWQIYHEALHLGRCDLTAYADSARQHRLFVSALSDHLLLESSSPCPIS